MILPPMKVRILEIINNARDGLTTKDVFEQLKKEPYAKERQCSEHLVEHHLLSLCSVGLVTFNPKKARYTVCTHR